jgi:uncharacterized protein YndB with AHSA1/START domain
MTVSAELSPVVVEVTVAREKADAFSVFTDEIGSWWPIGTHSIGDSKVATVVFEGGRLIERWHDGTEFAWGEVLAWEPPNRFVITWHPVEEPAVMTEVEVTFHAEGQGTRVRLEHRNWHALGDVGPSARRDYEAGWPGVLEAFVRASA